MFFFPLRAGRGKKLFIVLKSDLNQSQRLDTIETVASYARPAVQGQCGAFMLNV